MNPPIPGLEWPAADTALRGAAAALLLFHVGHALAARLPWPRRLLPAGFAAAVLAYLACSHPAFAQAPLPLRVLALSGCLMAAPLLWLLLALVFDDRFCWGWQQVAALGLAAGLGALAVAGVGGPAVAALHKLLMTGFAAAAVWVVVRDWRNDLVGRRRAVRSAVAVGLGVYVLVVALVELALLGRAAPGWLMLLHLGGIGASALVLAWLFARHPLQTWWGADGLPAADVAPPLPVQLQQPSPLPERAASIAAPLTPSPPAIDRRAALRMRLLDAMGTQRAYAQEGLTLAQLATLLGCTPEALREAIHRQLGYRNFNDFLHHYRIDEAAQRLLRQDLPILSIALDVGYGSIGPFNRAFKQLKNMTPSEFRQRGGVA